MRIVFCDDDPKALQTVRAYVTDFFESEALPLPPQFAAYTEGEALLKNEEAVDFAFLDVKLTGPNGISIGSELKKRNPHVKIFIVTAYPDYLDEAMRFQVFRYLSKPLDRERLYRNLEDALHQYLNESRRYTVTTDSGLVVVMAEDIVSVEAAGRRVRVHTVNGSYLNPETMEHWKSVLTLPCLYVTHRSCIVNMRYVARIETDTVFLKYEDREWTAYLSYRNFRPFQKAFLSYLEEIM